MKNFIMSNRYWLVSTAHVHFVLGCSHEGFPGAARLPGPSHRPADAQPDVKVNFFQDDTAGRGSNSL